MDTENVDAQVDVVEQEEQTSEETNFDSQDEETVTIPKSKYTAIRRKATAYDATKDAPQKITNSSDAKKFERLELKVEGYSDDEINHILKNGGKEALSNPFVTQGIEALRTQKKAEAAMLGDEGQKSGGVGNLSPTELSKMTAEELLKVGKELK